MPVRSLRWARGLGLGIVLGVGGSLSGGRPALGQFLPGGGGLGASPTAATGAMSGNPFLNPYANPLINPALNQQQSMTPANAALYFFAAQQATGGIGSGRMSGARPGPGLPPQPMASGRSTTSEDGPRGLSN